MKPTSKQLSYLRALALRAGQTFTPPATRAAASREINRLRNAEAANPRHRADERRDIAQDLARGDGTSARRDRGTRVFRELARTGGPAMSTPTTATDPSRPVRVGERVELARYTVANCERLLYGQRIDGVVRFLVAGPVVVVAWAVA